MIVIRILSGSRPAEAKVGPFLAEGEWCGLEMPIPPIPGTGPGITNALVSSRH